MGRGGRDVGGETWYRCGQGGRVVDQGATFARDGGERDGTRGREMCGSRGRAAQLDAVEGFLHASVIPGVVSGKVDRLQMAAVARKAVLTKTMIARVA